MKTPNDPRHQTRTLALSLVYSNELLVKENSQKKSYESIKKTAIHNLDINNYDKKMLERIVTGVTTHNTELKSIITQSSKDWEVESMYLIDLSILLIATWELYYDDTPQKVIVDEAVELAKTFGSKDSSKFVNGILAGIITIKENETKNKK